VEHVVCITQVEVVVEVGDQVAHREPLEVDPILLGEHLVNEIIFAKLSPTSYLILELATNRLEFF
jgi:hypothetical protein